MLGNWKQGNKQDETEAWKKFVFFYLLRKLNWMKLKEYFEIVISHYYKFQHLFPFQEVKIQENMEFDEPFNCFKTQPIKVQEYKGH